MVRLSFFLLIFLFSFSAFAGKWIELSEEIRSVKMQLERLEIDQKKRTDLEDYLNALEIYGERNPQNASIPEKFRKQLYHLIQNRSNLGILGEKLETIYQFAEYVESKKEVWKSASKGSRFSEDFLVDGRKVQVDFQVSELNYSDDNKLNQIKKELFFQFSDQPDNDLTLGVGSQKVVKTAVWSRSGDLMAKLTLKNPLHKIDKRKYWKDEKKILTLISRLDPNQQTGLTGTYGFTRDGFYQKKFKTDLSTLIYTYPIARPFLVHPKLKSKMAKSEQIRILTQLSSGLNQLHALGIVHADVKPDNVLVNCDEQNEKYTNCVAGLTDFGVSYFASEYLHESKPLRGTPHYLPLEFFSHPKHLKNADLSTEARWIGKTDEEKIINVQKGDIFGLAEIAYYLWINQELPWLVGKCDDPNRSRSELWGLHDVANFLSCKNEYVKKIIESDEKRIQFDRIGPLRPYHSLDHLILRGMDPEVRTRITSAQFLAGMNYIQRKYGDYSAPTPISRDRIQSALKDLPGFSVLDWFEVNQRLKNADEGAYIVYPARQKPEYLIAISYKSTKTQSSLIVNRILDVTPDSLTQVSDEIEFLKQVGTLGEPLPAAELQQSQAAVRSDR